MADRKETEPMNRLTVKLRESLIIRLKTMALKEHRPVQDVVEELIEAALKARRGTGKGE